MSIHGTRYAVSRSQVPPLHGCSRRAGTRNGAGPRLAIRVNRELVGDARTHQELPGLQFSPVDSIDKATRGSRTAKALRNGWRDFDRLHSKRV